MTPAPGHAAPGPSGSGPRRAARIAALAILYQVELSGESAETAIEAFFEGGLARAEGLELDGAARRFAEHLVRGTLARRDELDRLIRSGSEHWRLERMAVVDRNVLRLALFELLDDPSTPAPVILDEAVELAKAFGGAESGAFVNGVVDGIRRRLASGEIAR
ncbi:MAG: transcription antitermination factor NusB [Acidobacteriota bacterium]|nr:MAG: transcription antitermination factor NusB [Acidobacteriota bacterium]